MLIRQLDLAEYGVVPGYYLEDHEMVVPDGYRLLRKRERISEGDLYLGISNTWGETSEAGRTQGRASSLFRCTRGFPEPLLPSRTQPLPSRTQPLHEDFGG